MHVVVHAAMRRHNHARGLPCSRIWRDWLLGEDVEYSSAKAVLIKSIKDGVIVEHTGPPDYDDPGPGRKEPNATAIDKPLRRRRRRERGHKDVGIREGGV